MCYMCRMYRTVAAALTPQANPTNGGLRCRPIGDWGFGQGGPRLSGLEGNPNPPKVRDGAGGREFWLRPKGSPYAHSAVGDRGILKQVWRRSRAQAYTSYHLSSPHRTVRAVQASPKQCTTPNCVTPNSVSKIRGAAHQTSKAV
eukprot:gene12654-biopygen433